LIDPTQFYQTEYRSLRPLILANLLKESHFFTFFPHSRLGFEN